MNTSTQTASTTTILAIDLGKYKSVACVSDEGTGECQFVTFDTSRAEPRPLCFPRPLFSFGPHKAGQ
jgi:hypothetical protein